MKHCVGAVVLAATLIVSASLPISAAVAPASARASVKSKELKGQLPSTLPIPADAKVLDGRSAYDAMLEHVSSLNDYTFESGVITHKGHADVVETGRFYYKKPGQIRVEVEKAGMKSGSTLIRDNQGKIHAVPGKLLRFMSFELSADSDMLKTANGYSMLEVDFESLLSSTRRTMDKTGQKCKVTADANTYGPQGKLVRIIEITDSANRPAHRIVYSVESKTPLEWTVYKDGQILSTSVWKDLEQNSGLNDTLFQLSRKDEGHARSLDPVPEKPWTELSGERTIRGGASEGTTPAAESATPTSTPAAPAEAVPAAPETLTAPAVQPNTPAPEAAAPEQTTPAVQTTPDTPNTSTPDTLTPASEPAPPQ